MTVPFSWRLPYAWPRTPVLARNVVCTSQPLAAQAGLATLAESGTAVDAALRDLPSPATRRTQYVVSLRQRRTAAELVDSDGHWFATPVMLQLALVRVRQDRREFAL